jgi:hypothetical protein
VYSLVEQCSTKTYCFGQENCHANEKSEATAMRKVMPVIQDDKVVDKKIIGGG